MRRARPAPTVSVVIPTRDRREDVKRAVGSVLAQTFRSFEVIVVDDGSRDGTAEVLATFGNLIRYTRQPERGVAAARNAGLSLARGDLVALLDSDDRWLPEHLAVTVGLMRSHPVAVLASTTPGYRQSRRRRSHPAKVVDPFPMILAQDFTGHPSSVVLRRADVEAAGGFDEHLEANEDVDLWFRLALRGPFVLLARPTTAISRTRSSRSQTLRRDGAKLRATALSLRHLAAALERAGETAAAGSARGGLGYVEALQMLEAGHTEGVAEKLAGACEALPQLSEAWGYGLYRFSLVPRAREPAERLRQLQVLSSAWPDPGSPMATVWHAYGAAMALRTGRLRAAWGLLGRVRLASLGRVVTSWAVRRIGTAPVGWR